MLVAGGLGVPPLVRAAQAIAESEGSTSTAVFGYRNVRFGDGYVGRYADKTYSIDESEGNVVTLLDRIENELVNGELKPVVLSCGPLPMMKAAEQHANLYEQHEWKHPTQVAGIPWKNPVATASGTFQYAAVRWFYDVSQLGAVTTKGVSPVPWEGNPGIRTAEGPSSNINAVGLQNPGVDHYLEDDLPKLKAINATVIANVAGHCDDDYAEVVSKLDDSPADMLEINVSCPNVSAGGMSVGTDPVALSRLITRLRKLTDKKMIVKLTPNVTDITVPARAAVESGADARHRRRVRPGRPAGRTGRGMARARRIARNTDHRHRRHRLRRDRARIPVCRRQRRRSRRGRIVRADRAAARGPRTRRSARRTSRTRRQARQRRDLALKFRNRSM